MRTSIRSKLVILLVGLALLPLVVALLLVVIAGGRMRIQTFGTRIRQASVAEASSLQLSLVKDIEKLLLAVQQPQVTAQLAEYDTPLSPTERKRLDADWRGLEESNPAVRSVRTGPIAAELSLLASHDPRLGEILVTNRFGDLVAASARTTDFYQGDERWWTMTHNQGMGLVFVPPIDYDHSAGIWSVSLCVPILRDGELLGVCKAVLDLTDWVESIERTVGRTDTLTRLVRPDGTIVYQHGVEPLSETAAEWTGPIASVETPGWRTTDAGEIQGFAPMRLPPEIAALPASGSEWVLVLYVSREQAVGPIWRLGVTIFGTGMAIILLIFVAAVALVERSIVRRLRRLERATRSVAEGDLDARVAAGGRIRLLGTDEIDDLTEDFNVMVQRIQESYRALESANALKTDFIRVASHELRTPVSYMIGMARLMKDNRDPDRLLFAVQTMGSKAQRLNQIIQAMFKLMPGQVYAEEMNYSDVPLEELLEEIYLDSFPFLEARSLDMVFDKTGGKAPTIQADRDKLRDVIENLVMNAIKWTPDEGVVRIRVAPQLGGYVSISVSDEGPGIPESELAHVFEPFYAGGNVMQHSTGDSSYGKRGMGLGLAIVKHFVELHRGTVNVTTGPEGTTFTVSIPVEAPPQSERPEAPED